MRAIGNVGAMGQLLPAKDIPHVVDIWGRESRHDWDWWMKQVVVHLPRLLDRVS